MTIFDRRLQRSQNLKLLPFYLVFIVLTLLVSGNFFFWDTIQLGAKHALHFYETDFKQLSLPDEFDSGHIPAFGMYLALCWKMFGKSLMVSHLAMLPFLLGIVYQAALLLKKFIDPKYLVPALIVFLADATLLGQSVLVSPDIALVFFFLLGLNAVFSNRKWLIAMAGIGLVLTSMRGMMVTFALGLIELGLSFRYSDLKKSLVSGIRKIPPYVPAVVLIVAFNYWHYRQKGWFAYHEDSPWAASFEKVGFMGLVYNIGLLVWRFIDFGRAFLLLAALIIAAANLRKLVRDEKAVRLTMVFLIVLFSLSISFVMYKYLSGHRYLLPAFLSFSLLAIYLVFEKLKNEKLKYTLAFVLTAGLLSGNLWVYPANIAQGWDSSLAHLPYYKLRNEMLVYLRQENIAVNDVACTFPNKAELRYIDLDGSRQKHREVDLDNNRYVLYSNVYNDFSDEEISRLETGTEFVLLKEFSRQRVFLRLYKRK